MPKTKRVAPDPTTKAVQQYAAMQPSLRGATEAFLALITGLLDDAGINYLSVTGRTKSVASFAGKAARLEDGPVLYPSPITAMHAQIGNRVTTEVTSAATGRARAACRTGDRQEVEH